MKDALKKSAHILISRGFWQLSIFILFVIAGHHDQNSLHSMNLLISYISVFTTFTILSLLYLQNATVTNNLVLSKGLHLSFLFGCFLSVAAMVLAAFTLQGSDLLLPVQTANGMYPCLAIVVFLTYYLEGTHKTSLSPKIFLITTAIQSLLFGGMLQMQIPVLLSMALTLLFIHLLLAIYLLHFIRKDFPNWWIFPSLFDLVDLFTKGFPLAIGTSLQKYFYSLLVLKIQQFDNAETALFTPLTSLVFVVLLPQASISMAASLSSQSNFRSYVGLTLAYTLLVIIFFGLFLQLIIKFAYNVQIPFEKMNACVLSITLFFVAQVITTFVLSLARSLNFIKMSQLWACLAFLGALVLNGQYANSVFIFINTIAYCQIGCAIIVFWWIFRKSNSLALHLSVYADKR